MPTELVLELGGESSELERIAAIVEQLAAEHGWPDGLSYQVALALEELQINIMQHAYPQGTEAHSSIRLQCEADKLTIDIRDSGRPFNPLEDTKAPDLDASLEERKVGGLGVYLVKSLMDEMHYSREGDSNHLTLVKKLPEPEPGADAGSQETGA